MYPLTFQQELEEKLMPCRTAGAASPVQTSSQDLRLPPSVLVEFAMKLASALSAFQNVHSSQYQQHYCHAPKFLVHIRVTSAAISSKPPLSQDRGGEAVQALQKQVTRLAFRLLPAGAHDPDIPTEPPINEA